MAQRSEARAAAPGGPTLEVNIRILDDGRVVFGDLPPDLAEVAQLLAGTPVAAPAEPGTHASGTDATAIDETGGSR